MIASLNGVETHLLVIIVIRWDHIRYLGVGWRDGVSRHQVDMWMRMVMYLMMVAMVISTIDDGS